MYKHFKEFLVERDAYLSEARKSSSSKINEELGIKEVKELQHRKLEIQKKIKSIQEKNE